MLITTSACSPEPDRPPDGRPVYVFTREELSHATPAPLSLSDLRRKVSFPVFVPTRVPDGLAPAFPTGGDTPTSPITIAYYDLQGKIVIVVVNGPAGSGLAADPEQIGHVFRVRGEIVAHFLSDQPDFGGPALWWEESGAYIAISGQHLTQNDLVAIAASMSDTADLPPTVFPPD